MIEVPDQLIKRLEKEMSSIGYQLYYIDEEKIGNDIHLIIYVNKEKYKTIDIDEIVEVTRVINEFIDDYIDEKYVLEVSSAGINRFLYTRDHFLEVINKKIEVNLKRKYEGLDKRIISCLEQVTDDSIVIKDTNILFKDLKKAKLVGEEK